MYTPETLRNIYNEHGYSVPCMTETLLALGVPFDDAALLSRLPWHFPATRIAVERLRLGLSAVPVLPSWEVPPLPPAWLTPAVIIKMFDLALHGPGAAFGENLDEDDDDSCDEFLILPA